SAYFHSYATTPLSTSRPSLYPLFFFSHHTAPTEIYTLSLHRRSSDLQTQSGLRWLKVAVDCARAFRENQDAVTGRLAHSRRQPRSEEHTSELQSLAYLVCRLLLEKKKTTENCQRCHDNCHSTTMNRQS